MNDPHQLERCILVSASQLLQLWSNLGIFSIPCVKMLPSGKQKTTITLQKLNHQSWKKPEVIIFQAKRNAIFWSFNRNWKELTPIWTRTCPVISYHHRWTTRRPRNDCFFSTPEETGIITLDGYRWWISNEDLFFYKKLAEQKPFQETIPAILSNLQCVGSRISFTLRGRGLGKWFKFFANLGPKENVKKTRPWGFWGSRRK